MSKANGITSITDQQVIDLLIINLIMRDNSCTKEEAQILYDCFPSAALTHAMNGLTLDSQDLEYTNGVFNGIDNN